MEPLQNESADLPLSSDEGGYSAEADSAVQEATDALVEQMGKFHPHEPHWYLPLIGTDPAFQGKGFGADLMAHAIWRCDERGETAYLESSNPANVPFYERFGFKVMGEIQQGSSPTLIPMLREAR